VIDEQALKEGPATSTSVAILASSKEIYWNRLMGLPKASRVLVYSMVRRSASSAATCEPMAHTRRSCWSLSMRK